MRKFYALVAMLMALPIFMAAPSYAGHISSPKTLYVNGCDESQSNTFLDERRDDFNKATAHVGLPVDAKRKVTTTADYKLWVRTRYFRCFTTGGADKIKADEWSFCVQKLDGVDPPTSGDGHIRSFWVNPVWDTTAGTGDPVNPDQHALYWNGRGSSGDTVCSDWWALSTISHWMSVDNNPYVQAAGHADVELATDEKYTFYDVNTGSATHYIHPANDPIIAT